jgi:predicted AAA+ superfamily ATPase
MFIERTLSIKLQAVAQQFPVITLTGPRQSGKTSLVKALFPAKPYVSLEEPDIRQIALTDPRGFLSNFPQGAILDEVQHVPELFSYIQTIVDREREAQFILTGSSNFLLLENVSQTLAGRTIILQLLPFSMAELEQGGYELASYEQLIFTGQYPRIYDRDLAPTDFYPSYIQTYVERDVRLIKNITNLNAFIQFSQLCAGRVGQLLNYTSLANDAGISPNTVKTWLSVLEAAYIVYRLYPYHKNFNKRLIKAPKLYFYDTGLACSLLGIRQSEQVGIHFLRGALFENLIINEFVKRALHQGERPQLYFWQDNKGREIDCLLERQGELVAVELKSGKTAVSDYFANLRYWQQLNPSLPATGFVVYGGDLSLQTAVFSVGNNLPKYHSR